jgi:hypothetical protein
MDIAPCKHLFFPHIRFDIYIYIYIYMFICNNILFLGCRNGPMNAEVKPLRSVVRRKRTRPTHRSQPEDVSRIFGLLNFLCICFVVSHLV